MTKPKFYSRFNRPSSVGLICGLSKTSQAFKDEVNINNIVTGRTTNSLPPRTQKPMFGVDLSNVGSLQDLLQATADANTEWEKLPQDLRLKFHNNPQEMIDFISDEKNTKECIKLGLKDVKDVVKPIQVQVIDDSLKTESYSVTDSSAT